MQITQLLGLFLLTSFLSGCVYWYVDDPPPEKFSNTDLLESLIGQKSESVIKKLGLPDEFLLDGDKQFMVYWAGTSRTHHLFWLDPYHPHDTSEGVALYCLRIQLDSDGFVVKYPWVKSIASHPQKNCRNIFWSKEELLDLEVITDFSLAWKEAERKSDTERAEKEAERAEKEAEREAQKTRKLKQKSEQGDTDAQLTLFKELRSQDTDQALGWLCKSADLDNQEARSIMAEIYEYGGYTWIKKGVVQQNYKLAYVWHALSGLYDQEDLRFFADRYLTSKRQLDAKKMLEDWQPGNCERELRLVQGD